MKLCKSLVARMELSGCIDPKLPRLEKRGVSATLRFRVHTTHPTPK
jgi:hypothetical protein